MSKEITFIALQVALHLTKEKNTKLTARNQELRALNNKMLDDLLSATVDNFVLRQDVASKADLIEKMSAQLRHNEKQALKELIPPEKPQNVCGKYNGISPNPCAQCGHAKWLHNS